MNVPIQTDSITPPLARKPVPNSAALEMPEAAFALVFLELAEADQGEGGGMAFLTPNGTLETLSEEGSESLVDFDGPAPGDVIQLDQSNGETADIHKPPSEDTDGPDGFKLPVSASVLHGYFPESQNAIAKLDLATSTSKAPPFLGSEAIDIAYSSVKAGQTITNISQFQPGSEKQFMIQSAPDHNLKDVPKAAVADLGKFGVAPAIKPAAKAESMAPNLAQEGSFELGPSERRAVTTPDVIVSAMQKRNELPSGQSSLFKWTSGVQGTEKPLQYGRHPLPEGAQVSGSGQGLRKIAAPETNQNSLTQPDEPAPGTARNDLATSVRPSGGRLSTVSAKVSTPQIPQTDEHRTQGIPVQQEPVQVLGQSQITGTQFLASDDNLASSGSGLQHGIEVSGVPLVQGVGGTIDSSFRAANLKFPRVVQQLIDAMPKRLNQPVEIVLNPEELGKVRMTLTGNETQISVSIHAERVETIDLMRRHLDLLTEQYQALGYSDISFSFDDQQEQHQDSEAPSEQSHFSDSEESNQPSMTTQNVSTTGIDIRV